MSQGLLEALSAFRQLSVLVCAAVCFSAFPFWLKPCIYFSLLYSSTSSSSASSYLYFSFLFKPQNRSGKVEKLKSAAVCGKLLQSARKVLQSVAKWCSLLAKCCSLWQSAAVCWQSAAVCGKVLQSTGKVLQSTVKVLQSVAKCCSLLGTFLYGYILLVPICFQSAS